MANLNLEPGDATLDEMIAGDRARRATCRPTARGRSTTRATSSSSAASAGRLIENGKLDARRARTRTTAASPRRFWRSLTMVGNARHAAGAGHAELRQGRAEPGDPRRPRVAGVRVRGRRRLRRRELTWQAHDMVGVTAMEHYFEAPRGRRCRRALGAGERYTASFDAEETDFVRMNRGKVRQPGSVAQRYLTIRLIARHAARGAHALADRRPRRGRPRGARRRRRPARRAARTRRRSAAAAAARRAVEPRPCAAASLPPSEAVIDEVLAAAAGLDLVGIYAAGPVWRGFANSEGQRNWHATTTFNLHWSLYHRADKAVKTGYAGFAWDRGGVRAQDGRGARAARAHQRGRRARSPRASTARTSRRPRWRRSPRCCAGAASRAARSRRSRRALAKMQDGRGARRARDAHRGHRGRRRAGVPGRRASRARRACRSSSSGALVGSLVSPRTAREFGLAANGANGAEMPESLAMAGGTLADRRRAGGARHGPRDRQPVVPQLLRPPGVPDHRHDALRDVLGRGRQGRGAGRRAALRRHGLPAARREPRGADGGDGVHPRRGHLPVAAARERAPARRAGVGDGVHAVGASVTPATPRPSPQPSPRCAGRGRLG